jgi:hypothetical protein
MSTIIGSCEQCNGEVIQLDALQDWALYSIFGEFMAEHEPGCPSYPKMREMKLGDL